MADNNAPQFKYDYKAVNRDVPIKQVLQDYGVKIERNGRARCIKPEHTDKNPSMSINDKNGHNNCHCFSCNSNFSPVDVVVLTTGVSSTEAVKALIRDYLGNAVEDYSNAREIKQFFSAQRSNRFNDTLPISEEDFDTLQLRHALNMTYRREAEGTTYMSMLEYDAMQSLLIDFDEEALMSNDPAIKENVRKSYDEIKEKLTNSTAGKEKYYDVFGHEKHQEYTYSEVKAIGRQDLFSQHLPEIKEWYKAQEEQGKTGRLFEEYQAPPSQALLDEWKPRNEVRYYEGEYPEGKKEPYKDTVFRRKDIEAQIISHCGQMERTFGEVLQEQSRLYDLVQNSFTSDNIKLGKAIHDTMEKYANEGRKVTINEQQQNMLSMYELYMEQAAIVKAELPRSLELIENLARSDAAKTGQPINAEAVKNEQKEMVAKYYSMSYIKQSVLEKLNDRCTAAYDIVETAKKVAGDVSAHRDERQADYNKYKAAQAKKGLGG